MHKTKKRFSRKPINTRRQSGRPRNSTVDINQLIAAAKSTEDTPQYITSNSFKEFALSDQLLGLIQDRGYKLPTEIQDKTLQHTLSGKDLIGIAGTGTGKTGAFLIPLINRLLSNKQQFYSLIITPTRELALQIEDEFKQLTKGTGLTSTTLIGGTNMNKSLAALNQPKNLVIGTPGRIIDMAERGKINFKNFPILVLDEFDRMLDMGFIRDIEKIVRQMTSRKQTLLFSATMPESQRAIVQKIVRNPLEVKATTALKSANRVSQEVITVTDAEDKYSSLVNVIINEKADESRVILFCETKHKANRLSRKLTKSGIPSGEIHGNKSQNAREKALNQFKKGQIRVLVATDVMARGIDVSDVTMVINYEVPRTYDDYIHRIGRTGRAGKTGKAVTFID